MTPTLPNFALVSHKIRAVSGRDLDIPGDKVTFVGTAPEGKAIFAVATGRGATVRWAQDKRGQAWRDEAEKTLGCVILFR